MKMNKSLMLILILVFVVGFSFSVYYFKGGHSKLESVLYELTKVRVTIELIDSNYKLPSNFGIEESKYKNLIQALINVDKIVELADDPNIKFIRAPLTSALAAQKV